MKMANLQVQAPPVDFSNHNLSHSYTSTCDMGELIPIWWQRVYPNDRVDVSSEVFVRFAPLVYPILAEMNLKLFTFYVPTIALWNHWKKFYSEKELNDAPKKPFFYLNQLWREFEADSYAPRTLADYLGMPMEQFFSGRKDAERQYINDKMPLDNVREPIGVEPFLVYQMIYNRYFRDENLQPDLFDEDNTVTSLDEEIPVESNLWHLCIDGRGNNILEGPSAANATGAHDLFRLRRKAWEKDLFTSALPSPQFGDPVNVPVFTDISFEPSFGWDGKTVWRNASSDGTPIPNGDITGVRLGADHNLQITVSYDDQGQQVTRDFTVDIDNSENLRAVGGNFTINDLRMASAVQRYQESLMRAGHRYEEQMRYQFDQVVPNASLREPELLAASSIPIQISEISQTSATAETPLGTQAGQAFTYQDGRGRKTKFHAPDNGYMMTIMCVVPRTSYCNGLSKEWQLFDRLDYFNPIFEEVGDEPLYNKEVFLSNDTDVNEQEFGYIPRYAREKVALNKTTGEMTNTLVRMNLARLFDRTPLLNKSFIEVDSNTTDRGFAIEDSELANHLWFIAKNHIFMRRPMQYNPIPRLK